MENRKKERFKRMLPLNIEDKGARTKNVSSSGLEVVTGSPPKSASVDLKIFIGSKIYNLKGRVKWIKKHTAQKINDVGICITEYPKEYENELIKMFPDMEIDAEEMINLIFNE